VMFQLVIFLFVVSIFFLRINCPIASLERQSSPLCPPYWALGIGCTRDIKQICWLWVCEPIMGMFFLGTPGTSFSHPDWVRFSVQALPLFFNWVRNSHILTLAIDLTTVLQVPEESFGWLSCVPTCHRRKSLPQSFWKSKVNTFLLYPGLSLHRAKCGAV
jgi:hypothetical protein